MYSRMKGIGPSSLRSNSTVPTGTVGYKRPFIEDVMPSAKRPALPRFPQVASQKMREGGEKKRAVIIVSTHGLLFVKDDAFQLRPDEAIEDYYLDNERLAENIETFPVPLGINIIKYTEIPPGLTNIISEDTVDDYTNILYGEPLAQAARIEFLRKLYDPNGIDFLSPEMDDFIAGIVSDIKVAKQVESKEIQTIAAAGDIDYKRNYWYYDRGYTVDRFGPGEIMANKGFTVEPNDVYGASNKFVTSSANWMMGLLTPPNFPVNIYDQIRLEKGMLYNGVQEYINMELLLNYLKDHGYTEVIFFDLTCAVLDTTDGQGEPRFPRDKRVSGFINEARKRKISGGGRVTKRPRKNKRKTRRMPSR